MVRKSVGISDAVLNKEREAIVEAGWCELRKDYESGPGEVFEFYTGGEFVRGWEANSYGDGRQIRTGMG